MQAKMEHFRKMLRKLRLEKDVVQKKLAGELGISSTYYSELERGEKTPALELVFKIADYYGVSIALLFGENNIL